MRFLSVGCHTVAVMAQRKRLYVCLDLPESVVSVVMAKNRAHARALIVKRLAGAGWRHTRSKIRVQEL